MAAKQETEEDEGEPDVLDAELKLRSTVFSTYLDKKYALATASIERYRTAASSVQTAAAAVGALYTGGLALVFGQDVGGLPARGLITPAYLALALVGSMIYLAYLRPDDTLVPSSVVPAALDGDGAKDNAYDQLADYSVEVRRIIRGRLWALRGAVGALALSIAFAPAPFTGTSSAADVPDWPEAPNSSSEAALTLFEAELAELATLRAAARASRGEFFSQFDMWWLTLAVAALLVLAATAVATYRTQNLVQRNLDQRRMNQWKDRWRDR
ncbi:hypothetical protein V2J56_14525 [Georgenia sp. MJ206]|uniref:hypothetical protein n=1 Tax=Georgenia wangjunii TaxID=3117730 RepID=UPI002F264111